MPQKNNHNHGMSSSKEYRAWIAMKTRCYDTTTPYYHSWGGRGIKVCDEWLNSFETFYKHVGPRPGGKFSLDRMDCDGDYLAWQSIINDINDEAINIDLSSVRQARQHLEQSQAVLKQSVLECYRWLISPFQDLDTSSSELKWEVAALNISAQSLIIAIESKAKEEEWIVSRWAPIHLSDILQKLYFTKGIAEVSTKKLLTDIASYPSFPRLTSPDVLREAIEAGLSTKDFFGYAAAGQAESFPSFVFGGIARAYIDEKSVLIPKETAFKLEQEKVPQNELTMALQNIGITTVDGNELRHKEVMGAQENSFFASKELKPQIAKLEFNEIVENVILNLTTRPKTFVRIMVEISALDEGGFETQLQTVLKRNCESLNFSQSGFAKHVLPQRDQS